MSSSIKSNTSGPKAEPGAVIAIQSFGDFLGFNSHLHILISYVYFNGNGMFTVSSAINTKDLAQIFRPKRPRCL